MADVFAYVSLRPCGCVCAAVTPRAVANELDDPESNMAANLAAGRIRSVATREEYLALPWRCDVCSKTA